MTSPEPPGWSATLRIYSHPRVLGMLVLGFSAGLPLLLVMGTLSFWLREAGIDRSTIGHLSWIGLAYGFKWMWSPLVDHLTLPLLTRWLGRRRSWLLLSQCLIAMALTGMALNDPATSLSWTVFFALTVAFASATQDIALDAYRIEAVGQSLQGAMAATYQAGYRVAMILASAGVLWIASSVDTTAAYDFAPWRFAYLVMAGCMGIGILATLRMKEPEHPHKESTSEHPAASTPDTPTASTKNTSSTGSTADNSLLRVTTWFRDAMVEPFRDFIMRYGTQAVMILALIAVYRISDVVMGVMSNPFYVDMGYTKDEVAMVSKVYGVIMTIVGAAAGGLLTARIGVMRTLFLGAFLSAVTNLLFVWLASRGHDLTGLVFTVSADNLSAGIASSAFVAWLSGLTSTSYTATQYALFSSVMLLLPKFLAGFSGDYVDAYGYASFFTATALLGLPVLLLVWKISRTGTETLSGKNS